MCSSACSGEDAAETRHLLLRPNPDRRLRIHGASRTSRGGADKLDSRRPATGRRDAAVTQTGSEPRPATRRQLRTPALAALMCLVLGGLGGLLAAAVVPPERVEASF